MDAKPLEALQYEHRTIERAVAAATVLAATLEDSGPLDLGVVDDLIRFFRVFGDECHHVKEDRFLFPLLEQKGVPSRGCPLGALKNEHDKGRELLRQLVGARDTYAGSGGLQKDALMNALRGLVELYPTHIWKEEYLLLPMAEKLLSVAEREELNEQFEQVEAGLGAGIHHQFEEVAARIERSAHPGPQRAPVITAGAFLEFDLAAEIEKLKQEPAWQSGRNAKTLAKYADLRIVLTVLKAGTQLQEHHSAGRISVQTISGRIRMHAADRSFELAAGRMLVLDRAVPHDVEAVQESAFLLTIAWPERRNTVRSD